MSLVAVKQYALVVLHIPYLFYVYLITILSWFVPRSWLAKDVRHDVVLITGAGSGLGREIAIQYAKLGSSLVLWDINKEGLEETRNLVQIEQLAFQTSKLSESESYCTGSCLTYRVDVSDRYDVQKAAQAVMVDLNRHRISGQDEVYVSVLVNNAGIYHGLMLQELRDDQIERIFKINILAHFWTVRAFLPQMIAHERGHIVEIASMGGIAGLVKQVDYSSTKFANIGFEESLSIELDLMGLSKKIRTTCVCPFFFQSNLFTGFDKSNAGLMSTKYVASETVMGMRCNHSRVLLPRFSAYALFLTKNLMPREFFISITKGLGLVDSIKQIKGAANEV